MIDQLKMLVANGDCNAMCELARHYKKLNDVENIVKYYNMAIEKGDTSAMRELGQYYFHNIGDYENMRKCYEKLIENGDAMGYCYLSYYHLLQTKDYATMEKYCFFAIDMDQNKDEIYKYAMNNLKYY